MSNLGTVYLVGAGPGDAGLLTLRGAELLKRADLVVYDALVNPELLRLAPSTAEKLYAGKRSRDHAIPQEDLNQLLVRQAQAGKTVVRLKGGDPYVFGRGGEEALELQEAGVPFEVVPGISSVVAAPMYAGIPVTHREFCSSYHVFTGHEDPTKPHSSLDWEQIAKLQGTRVLLMAVERIGVITEALMAHGAAPETPVGMVRWGTTGRQETLVGTLATIAGLVAKHNFQAPAVTVIGGVVSLRDQLNWFENRPLFGTRIVVTRTRTQASQLSARLLERGADVSEIPTIRIEPPSEKMALTEAIVGIHEYDWILFTSPNGVIHFFDYFFKAYRDIRSLGRLKIAAVGPATAAKLTEMHLEIDAMPSKFVASAICSAMKQVESLENLRCLLVRAEVANADLPKQLEDAGAIVDDVPIYRTVPETEDPDGAAAALLSEGADWITFTSSSTVTSFQDRFDLGALRRKFPEMRLASIGPETTKALQDLGLEPDIEARQHTIDGLVDALVQVHARGDSKTSSGR